MLYFSQALEGSLSELPCRTFGVSKKCNLSGSSATIHCHFQRVRFATVKRRGPDYFRTITITGMRFFQVGSFSL
jgi:hypothetical protein